MTGARTPRPRILQVLYSGLGGHYAVATALIRAGGSDDDWDHHLLFFGIEPVAPGYAEECDTAGISFSYVKSRAGRPFLAWPALIREVRRIAPQAIILHSIKAILAIRRAAGGTPLIAVEHQSNSLKTRAEWGASLAAQWLADRVVTLSRDYAAGLRARLGPLFNAKHTVIVPTGIDTDAPPRPRPPLADPASARIGMAARVTPTKGQEVLVEAAAILRRQTPDTAIALTMPGDGPCLPAVRAAVQAHGVSDIVELPGHVAAQDLPEWYSGLDIYVHCSDGETLSTALLQAMAAGLPIVASDVPGISDLLGPPGEGEEPLAQLVPARDPQAFADAIAGILRDPAAALARAERARSAVRERNSLGVMRAGYADLIETTCREKSST